jgi:hypothetical protein
MILYTGGHLGIHTPLTDIFIITALYVIYGAATLDSLLSALIWCGMRGLNSRHSACKADATTTELIPQLFTTLYFFHYDRYFGAKPRRGIECITSYGTELATAS